MAAIYVAAARQAWGHIYGDSELKSLRPPVDRLRAEIASADPEATFATLISIERRLPKATYGTSSKASTWFGRTTVKWRRSRVAIVPRLSRSAVAIT